MASRDERRPVQAGPDSSESSRGVEHTLHLAMILLLIILVVFAVISQ